MSQLVPKVRVMDLALLVAICLLAALAGSLAGLVVASRRAAAARSEQRALVDAALGAARAERAEGFQAALDTALSVAAARLDDHLAAGTQAMVGQRSLVEAQVAAMHQELTRVGQLVTALQQDRARQHGQLAAGLDAALRATDQLADTTRCLREALASPKARGQWGERMAGDVLRLAGFHEGINYRTQTRVAGGGVPDYTFLLPKGHVVHMDVKFPVDNYLRHLEAANPAEADEHRKAFLRDVRNRVAELGGRSYIDPEVTVDYLLLFIPNESVYGFLHQHDPQLIDAALAQKVVLCSPFSLFAVLAVIRQAVDNFLVERTSDEILAALGRFTGEWNKLSGSIDKVGRGLDAAAKAYDELAGTRRRQFQRQLDAIEDLRDRRRDELPRADPDRPRLVS
jgi:DNA recombination protein RmuC